MPFFALESVVTHGYACAQFSELRLRYDRRTSLYKFEFVRPMYGKSECLSRSACVQFEALISRHLCVQHPKLSFFSCATLVSNNLHVPIEADLSSRPTRHDTDSRAFTAWLHKEVVCTLNMRHRHTDTDTCDTQPSSWWRQYSGGARRPSHTITRSIVLSARNLRTISKRCVCMYECV